MHPVRFEPKISAGERPQNHALDRAATGTGWWWWWYENTVLWSNQLLVMDKDLELVVAYLKAWTLRLLKEVSCLRGLIDCIRVRNLTAPINLGLRGFVAGLSLHSDMFSLRSAHVGFVVNKVVLWHIFLPTLPLSDDSIIPAMLHSNLSVTGTT
jgi:hypothetical protein